MDQHQLLPPPVEVDAVSSTSASNSSSSASSSASSTPSSAPHFGEIPRNPRWWMGGVSDCTAALVTHPMDMLKTQLQTQQTRYFNVRQLVAKVVQQDGILGLYNGLTASWLRMGTYCTARWFIYNKLKATLTSREHPMMTFGEKVFCAVAAGSLGGIVGIPADKVNVRMQNDVKLPKNQRRNYRHVFHGLYVIIKEEGFRCLFTGSLMFCSRAVFIALGQFVTYDQLKQFLLSTIPITATTTATTTASSSSSSSSSVATRRRFPWFKDDFWTHLICSFGAGTVASILAQPFDTLKTRMQISTPGEFKNYLELIRYTGRMGIGGFYKGFVPAWVRLGTQTVLIFLIFEQLRIRFGTPRFGDEDG